MRRSTVVVGAAAFVLLATLNAGGYRYGSSDQAFYIPAVLHHLDPQLYPRDWSMIGAQGRYFLVDELFAGLVRVTGIGLPQWFLAAQLATLALFYAGAVLLGRSVLTTPWAMAAWIAALTLRHRIAKTGANTLEGYFHPRMFVFAAGLAAVALFLRGRPWWALGVALLSATIHPTTAALFVAIIAVGIVVSEPRARVPVLVTGIAAAGAFGVAVLLGVFDVATMDAAWIDVLATKDYVFPTRWSPGTWMINLLGPAVLVAASAARYRAGLGGPRELGLVAGCLALFAGFLVSLPLVARGVALAVQLQTSRAFWPVETIATVFLVWAVIDGPLRRAPTSRWPRVLAAVLMLTSVSRGIYVGFLENPERPVFAVDLPRDDWGSALHWIRTNTSADTFVLADPGHAWKFGTAVRIGARRDVFLEETKDVAMAMYSKAAADRVRQRIGQVAGFADMDVPALLALASAEGVAVLVTERPLDLPVLHRAGAVAVYRLSP